MSARDWSTIGVSARSSLPHWIAWSIPPLLAPLAAMAWVTLRWSSIPARFATHFDGNRADGWSSRTFLHVFGPLIFAEGLVLLLFSVMLATWYGSGRPSKLSPVQAIPLGVQYLMGVIFSIVGLSPVMQLPMWPIAVAVPLLVIAAIVLMAREQSKPDDAVDDTPKECWDITGMYYNNPKDPRLFVKARDGGRFVANMSNPWASRFLFGLFGSIALLIGFLLWALH